MEYTFANAHITQPRQRTWLEAQIEARATITRQLYYHPAPTSQLEHWYLDEILDPYVAPRVKDLYDDREQTNRQQGAFFVAKMNVVNERDMWIDAGPNMQVLYGRVLDLYDARQKYIQEEGVRRLSIWSHWWTVRQQPSSLEQSMFITACKSTLDFMEDDYIKRKVDFATEVYAVLEKHDSVRADEVLDDLGDMYPWLKRDFIKRMKEDVIAYDGLKGRLPQV